MQESLTLAQTVRPAPQEYSKLVGIRAAALICGFIALLTKKPNQHLGFWYWFGLISFGIALVCYAVAFTRYLRRKAS